MLACCYMGFSLLKKTPNFGCYLMLLFVMLLERNSIFELYDRKCNILTFCDILIQNCVFLWKHTSIKYNTFSQLLKYLVLHRHC